MGPIGVQEMIGIFLIALLLFGPKKLPELGRMLGKGLSEFRRMKNELKTTFDTHMQELEREARLAEAPKQTTLPPVPDYSSVQYPYPYEDSVALGPTYETAPALQDGTEAAGGSNGSESSEPVPGTIARGKSIQPSSNGDHATPVPAPLEEEHQA
jgi:sec-independent protein translocase protein TatA